RGLTAAHAAEKGPGTLPTRDGADAAAVTAGATLRRRRLPGQVGTAPDRGAMQGPADDGLRGAAVATARHQGVQRFRRPRDAVLILRRHLGASLGAPLRLLIGDGGELRQVSLMERLRGLRQGGTIARRLLQVGRQRLIQEDSCVIVLAVLAASALP